MSSNEREQDARDFAEAETRRRAQSRRDDANARFPRTVTVRTSDHGDVPLVEPDWCLGQHEDGGYRADIFHEGHEQQLTLPTRRGPVELILAGLEQRPFTTAATGHQPFVNVGFGSDYYPSDPAGLDAMATALVEHAAVLRGLARELAALLGGDER